MELEVFKIAQVPGDLPRSFGVQGVTESLLKRYGLPLVILSPQVTAAVLVAYVGDGRFAEPKNAPPLDLIAIQAAADQPESVEPPAIPDPLSAPTLPMPAFLHGGVSATFADPSECAECF
ncbi:MAG: hypothetical protein ACRYFU_13670 [Janthinobacterium lividum]